MTALHARQRTGKGQNVESSLTNGLISMMAYLSAEYLATGEIPKRTGNNHPIASPYGLFRASDGRVAVAPSNDVFVLQSIHTWHIFLRFFPCMHCFDMYIQVYVLCC